jgi:predicted lactoylglutathione lyase
LERQYFAIFLLSNDLKTLPKKKFAMPIKNTEVLIAIDADSREKMVKNCRCRWFNIYGTTRSWMDVWT